MNKLKTLGSYDVHLDSSTKRLFSRCQIFVNGGSNLCRNKRGHNIVVIDTNTDEYESVSFDTWGSKEEVCFYFVCYRSSDVRLF